VFCLQSKEASNASSKALEKYVSENCSCGWQNLSLEDSFEKERTRWALCSFVPACSNYATFKQNDWLHILGLIQMKFHAHLQGWLFWTIWTFEGSIRWLCYSNDTLFADTMSTWKHHRRVFGTALLTRYWTSEDRVKDKLGSQRDFHWKLSLPGKFRCWLSLGNDGCKLRQSWKWRRSCCYSNRQRATLRLYNKGEISLETKSLVK
jgi:hypothetical protein